MLLAFNRRVSETEIWRPIFVAHWSIVSVIDSPTYPDHSLLNLRSGEQVCVNGSASRTVERINAAYRGSPGAPE